MPNYFDQQQLDPRTMQAIQPGMGVEQRPNFSMAQRIGNGLRGFSGNQDLAMALLANSGASPQKRSFGEIYGTSMMQAQQMKQGREDDAFKRQYMQAQMAHMLKSADPRSNLGNYQPGDYTPESWAEFIKSQDPSMLKRYTTPRQDFSPSFQNVTKTNPDGSTQQGTFNTRTGEYDWMGAVVPGGKKSEVDAAGTAKGKVAGDLEAKGPRAYQQFQVGIKGLESAMADTMTGPIAGRIPAMTAAQQTAEGAENVMAPVLKQLFRESGEGTFSDGDQAILLKMVPNRKDHPETRAAKIAMIDGIVKAKLGIKDAEAAPPPFTISPQQPVKTAPTLDDIRKKYGR